MSLTEQRTFGTKVLFTFLFVGCTGYFGPGTEVPTPPPPDGPTGLPATAQVEPFPPYETVELTPAGTYPEPHPWPRCSPGTPTGNLLTYLNRLVLCHTSARTERLATMKTAKDVYERQAYVRGRMLAQIGGFPQRTPLHVKVVKTTQRNGYKIENIIYQSQPGFFVTANLYVPTTGTGPYPAVLSVSGHGSGGKSGSPRYFANRLANRGFVVLAYDPPGQGERLDLSNGHFTWSEHANGVPEHTYYGVHAELTGQNFARHEVWDGIRAIDYLYTRPDVDQSKGVGIMGCSGGGTQSAFMAAFDPRISAAAPACYMTRWPEWNMLYIDAEQAWPDFLRDGLNFSDYPVAMAPQPGAKPRAFKMLQGAGDYFPIAGARATAAEAEEFYRLIGKPEQMDFYEFACPAGDANCSDGHGWAGPMLSEAYAWLDRWLQDAPPKVVSNNSSDFASVLGCTTTGHVATAPEIKQMCQESGVPGTCPKTVHTLSLERAQKLQSIRTITRASNAEQVRSVVASRIRVEERTGVPKATRTSELTRPGYKEERWTLETEAGFTVPTALLLPSSGGANGKFPAVVYVDGLSGAGVYPEAEELVGKGYAVFIVEPRGSDVAPHRLVRGLHVGTDYLRNVLASIVGKRLVGLRVTDVLRAFDYLVSRSEIDPARISLFGRDKGGVTVLHAGVLEPRFRAVAAENTLLSYMNFVSTKEHHGFLDLVIPGVLEDYDLPDLAHAAAPRPVWIVSPRRVDTTLSAPSPDAEPASNGTPASLAEAKATYSAPGTPSNVEVRLRPSGSSFVGTYGAWLNGN